MLWFFVFLLHIIILVNTCVANMKYFYVFSLTGAKYTYLLNLEPVRTAEQQNKLVAAEKLLLDKVETVANLISQLQSGSPTPGKYIY